jgi:hypothetical protein
MTLELLASRVHSHAVGAVRSLRVVFYDGYDPLFWGSCGWGDLQSSNKTPISSISVVCIAEREQIARENRQRARVHSA